MADYFTDSSALVKRYVDELGSQWVLDLFEPSRGNQVYIAHTTPVEIIASLTRRGLGGATTPYHAAAARRRFYADLRIDYQIIAFTNELLRSAMTLAESRGLRGYDALQLATALQVDALLQSSGLSGVIIVSSDRELNSAAIAEGLQVEDPNLHP